MRFHNPLHDREAKTSAAGRTIRLPETVEDRGQGVGGNPATCVPDDDLDVRRALPHPYVHAATSRCELDRVGHEIGDGLAHTLLVAAHRAQVSCYVRQKVHVTGAGDLLAAVEDVGDDRPDVHVFQPHSEGPGLHAGHVEKVCDQP